MGEFLCGRVLIESELSGEGAGVTGASFEDHFPDRIEARFAAPGETPQVFFRNPFFSDVAVEIEVDNVEATLWKDEEAIVSPAPSGGIHTGARGVGGDEEGHAMAVAADVGLRFAFVVSFEVEELESILGTL